MENEFYDLEERDDSPKELVPLHGNRLPTENDLHVFCSNEYLMLGPGRTITSLRIKLEEHFREGLIAVLPSYTQLVTWSKKFDWAARYVQYDANLVEYQQTQAALVFQHKLVKTWGRVELLIQMAEALSADFANNLWVPKSHATRKKDKTGPAIMFNVRMVQQLRGVLDDIAKETGGRGVGLGDIMDHTSTPEQAVDLSKLSDDEIDNLSDMLNSILESDDD